MLIFHPLPISLLTDRIVRSGLVIAWRLATSPMRTSPSFAKATTEGVVRLPSVFAITVGSPPSSTATTEFVVPRSIPTAFAMFISYSALSALVFSADRAASISTNTRPDLFPKKRKVVHI